MSEQSWEDKFWSVYEKKEQNLKRAWKAENTLREVRAMLEPLLTTANNPSKDLNAKREVFSDYLDRAMEAISKVNLDELK